VVEHVSPPSSPEDARRLAEAAVDWARLYAGCSLDFSPASLRELDRLLHGYHIVGGLQAHGELPAEDDEEGAIVVTEDGAGKGLLRLVGHTMKYEARGDSR